MPKQKTIAKIVVWLAAEIILNYFLSRTARLKECFLS
jgi:hypothetical protein